MEIHWSDRTPILVKILLPPRTCDKNAKMCPKPGPQQINRFCASHAVWEAYFFDPRMGFLNESWFLKHLCNEKLKKLTKSWRANLWKSWFHDLIFGLPALDVCKKWKPSKMLMFFWDRQKWKCCPHHWWEQKNDRQRDLGEFNPFWRVLSSQH